MQIELPLSMRVLLLIIVVIKSKSKKISTFGQKYKPQQIKIRTDGVEYTI